MGGLRPRLGQARVATASLCSSEATEVARVWKDDASEPGHMYGDMAAGHGDTVLIVSSGEATIGLPVNATARPTLGSPGTREER